ELDISIQHRRTAPATRFIGQDHSGRSNEFSKRIGSLESGCEVLDTFFNRLQLNQGPASTGPGVYGRPAPLEFVGWRIPPIFFDSHSINVRQFLNDLICLIKFSLRNTPGWING